MPEIDIFYLLSNILYFISYISYSILYIFIIVLCMSIALQLYPEVITKGVGAAFNHSYRITHIQHNT